MPAGVECIFDCQPEQLGLGHAVLCAERSLGGDPFAVLLADDFLTYEGASVTADLAREFNATGKIQLSVMEVNGPVISRYEVVPQMQSQDQLGDLLKRLMLTKRRLT